ncbi:hypothetical protein [Undibacterium squillarum]|uniref:Tape measure domain-containing protein n=1 Tax=Undibacterium squillarum TaxID=1131567 RepID=A0ABQ2Y204_9BURK|nr:hypothetical protein [Undibacterium squillarum]GGX52974.1 hypothetical protein GCM10010946_34450 [Undibacterium squillarum]
MAVKIGELIVQMGADIGQMRQEMTSAKGVVKNTVEDIEARVAVLKGTLGSLIDPIKTATSYLGPLSVGIGSILSVNAFANMVKGAVEGAAKMHDLSAATGVAVSSLSALAGVGKMSDTGLDAISAALNRLTKNMSVADEESRGAGMAIKALGIDFADFSKLSPDEQMLAIAKAMDQFQDGGGKVAVAMALFGKEGASLIPMLKDLAAVGELNGKMTAQQAAMADNYGDNMVKIKGTNEAWKKQISMAMLPVMDEMAQAWLDNINGVNGLNKGIKGLSQDGTLTDWARGAVTALTYVADVVQGLSGVVGIAGKLIGKMGAEVGAEVRMVGGIIDQIKQGKSGFGAVKDRDRELEEIRKQFKTDFDDLWNPKLMGEKIREAMEVRRQARAEEAPPEKEKLNFHQGGKDEKEKVDNTYANLTRAIREKISAQNAELEMVRQLTPAEQESLRIMTDLRDGVLRLSDAEKIQISGMLEKLLINEQAVIAQQAARKAAEDMEKAAQDNLKTLDQQIDAERKRSAQIGLTKAEIEALASKQMEADAQADELLAKNMREAAEVAGPLKDAYLSYAGALEYAATKRRTLAAIRNENEGKEKALEAAADAQKAREELDKLFDPTKGKDFGAAIKGALSEAVSSVAKLDAAMRQNAINAAAYDKMVALARRESNGDPEVLAKRMDAINKKSMENQLANYGQIAGAAKGFFNEQSRGYKALQAAEQVFQAIQLAMTLSTMAARLVSIESVTAATLGAEATKAAAIEAGVGIAVAADEVKGASAASVAVATQAQGDPYTAWPRMAAMAAVMAALGFATGFFGGGDDGADLAAQRQKTQGTGSVWGDAAARSESITKSLEFLKQNSDMMLPINQAMLSSLQAIEASMAGLTNLVLRTNGMTSGSNFGVAEGVISKGNVIGNLLSKIPLIGGLLGGLANLWGKTTQTITDAGLMFGGDLRSLQAGQGYSQYANVQTTSSSWFGLKKDTSNSVLTQGLSSELSDQFALIFRNLEKSLKAAAGGLGSSADEVTKILDTLKIDTTTVSLKGLTGQALQDAINGVISKVMDQMSEAAFKGLDAFRQVGEGYTQTVMRVASGVEVARYQLERFGLSAIAYQNVQNKQGDVAAEIFRQSVLAVEGMSGVGKILEGMTGQAKDLADAYAQLLDVRRLLKNVGLNGQALGAAMIGGAGGSKELGDALSVYRDKYFSDAERAAMQTNNVREAFAKLGIAMPASKEALRALIEKTGTSTDATAKLTGQLLALTGQFSDMVDAVQAAKNAQAEAIQQQIDGYLGMVDSLKKYRADLLLGSLSTKTPQERYAEARQQYEATLTAARAGDKDAQGRITSAANAFLEASRTVNASSEQYTADFAAVMSSTSEMEVWAKQQADLGQASLDALRAGVEATKQVEQAVKELGRDRNVWRHYSGGGGDPLADLAPALDLSRFAQPEEQSTALAAEVKRLNAQVAAMTEEIKGLRDDAWKQADTLADVTMTAASDNAKKVTESHQRVVKEQAWRAENRPQLRG